MNKMRKNALLAFGLMLMPSAFAVNPVEEPDSLINLQGVVISANKIRVNQSSVPLTISVILSLISRCLSSRGEEKR